MKKKILALGVCASMLAVAIVGGTMAYFTDTEQQTNEFAIGNISIDLYEKVMQTDGADKTIIAEQTLGKGTEEVVGIKYDNILPGHIMTKVATVENTGTNDAYVAMVIKNENYLNFNRKIDDYYEVMTEDQWKALGLEGITNYTKDNVMQKITDDIWSGDGWGLQYTKDISNGKFDVRYKMTSSNATSTPEGSVKVLGYGYANHSIDTAGEYYNYFGEYFANEKSYDFTKDGNFGSITNLHDRVWIVYLMMEPGASYTMDLTTTCPTYIDNNSINAFENMALDIKAFAIQSSGFTSDGDGQKAAFNELFKSGFDF